LESRKIVTRLSENLDSRFVREEVTKAGALKGRIYGKNGTVSLGTTPIAGKTPQKLAKKNEN